MTRFRPGDVSPAFSGDVQRAGHQLVAHARAAQRAGVQAGRDTRVLRFYAYILFFQIAKPRGLQLNKLIQLI